MARVDLRTAVSCGTFELSQKQNKWANKTIFMQWQKHYSGPAKDKGNENSPAIYHLCETFYIPIFSDSTMNYYDAFSTKSCEP